MTNQPFDGKAFAEEVITLVKNYVARSLQPFEARVRELELQAMMNKRFEALESRTLKLEGKLKKADRG